MSKASGLFLMATLLLFAQLAAAGDVEEMKGASSRDRITASRGLVLVDLYADW
jgi:hypothetical protein